MALSPSAPKPAPDPVPLFEGDWPTAVPDLASLPSERLEAEICTYAAHIDAALCRWLVLVGEFDRREGWASWECRSCAQWLSWKCGITRTTANDHVRVGRALLTRPAIRHAFARGEISYSKVRAITRIDEPVLDDELVDLARASTGAGLERIVRAFRRYGSIADDDTTARAHDQRGITWHFDDDGSFVIRGRLPADAGAVIVDALRLAHDERVRHEHHDLTDDSDTGTRTGAGAARADRDDAVEVTEHPVVADRDADTRSVDTADDLVHLARRYLGHTDTDGHRAGHELVILIDAELLTDDVLVANEGRAGNEGRASVDEQRDTTGDGERDTADRVDGIDGIGGADQDASPRPDRIDEAGIAADLEPGAAATRRARRLGLTCETSCGAALSPTVARRLACDATIVAALLDDDGTPLDLGRRHRVVNRRLRRALILRDRTCRFPGCTRRGHLEAHHLVHWINGGPTDADNLVMLCEHHHTRVHEGHWTLVGRPGQPLDARDPRGRTLRAIPRPIHGDPGRIESHNRDLGLNIHRRTNEPEWEGRGTDLDTVIDALDGVLARHHRSTGQPERRPTSAEVTTTEAA